MGLNRKKFLKLIGLGAAGTLLKNKSKDFLLAGETKTVPGKQPLTAKRWAMVIDIRKCNEKKDCTDCIQVCHNIHNVPEIKNPKHEVKWIWKEDYKHSFPNQEHKYIDNKIKNSKAILLCNHCDNPPCVRVCPTQATFKREKDGIVIMDMHRCIGCRFCMAACPYGSRSFNWIKPKPHIKKINPDYPTRMRGVVEKCNFCAERLAIGLEPACVEACRKKAKALVFGDVEDPNSEVRQILRSKYTIKRKPNLGTGPEVYYIV